jgi:hypothetical protein
VAADRDDLSEPERRAEEDDRRLQDRPRSDTEHTTRGQIGRKAAPEDDADEQGERGRTDERDGRSERLRNRSRRAERAERP